MLAKYATIVRRAAALTAVAAAIMVAVSAALVGVKGLIGALIGVAIVTVFFGISVLVVGRAARVSPGAMMVAAMVTYLVKIIALAIIVSNMNGATAFSTRTVGFVDRLHPGLERRAGHHGGQGQDAVRGARAASGTARRVT
jgi:ATP synthase protein I